eukprot:s853_g4.t6
MVLTVGEANERFLGLLEPMGFAALQTQLQHWRWGILGNPGLQWELAQSLLVKIPQATLRRDAVSSTAALNSCEKVIAFNAALGAMGNLGARAWSSALQLLGVLKIFHLRSDLASLGSCMAAGAEPGGWRSTLLLLQLIKYVGLGAPDLRSLKAACLAAGHGRLWRATLHHFDARQLVAHQEVWTTSTWACEVAGACGVSPDGSSFPETKIERKDATSAA